jgi:asparagine synthase (glutamine-hydrolysing)
MCGILCHVQRGARPSVTLEQFAAMLATLGRRGPDDRSIYEQDGILLGHTRLAIIDLVGGRQPVFNETGDTACILNGEIYNYRELRDELMKCGHRFQSQSDTEVIVHGYEQYGREILCRLRGMFAIVIADFAARRLLVARDRIGEKPLYYIDHPEFFCCASEVKALRHHPRSGDSVNSAALRSFLQFGFVIGRDSIFSGVRRLGPGEFLELSANGTECGSYWHGRMRTDPTLTRAEVVATLPDLVTTATRAQLVADVPVGVFLSGGLDSSIVVAAAARATSGTLRTFSIGFDRGTNELPHARRVAEMYSTDHTETILTSDAGELVDRVLDYFDEPFADSSSVPTFAVAREARRHVKVALTGDGGDELYCGYGAYLNWRYYSDSRLVRLFGRSFDMAMRVASAPHGIERLYPLPFSGGAGNEWRRLRSVLSDLELRTLLGPAADAQAVSTPEPIRAFDNDPVAQAMHFDLNHYLPDDLLKKVDMASMANGLESRAPLLDLDLIEFMLRVPSIEKVRNGQTKSIVREAFASWLPKDVVSRPKQGFGAPVANWLGGPLRKRIEVLKDSSRPLWRLIDCKAGQRMLEEKQRTLHLDWRAPHVLWTLMMLDGWAERHCPAASLS